LIAHGGKDDGRENAEQPDVFRWAEPKNEEGKGTVRELWLSEASNVALRGFQEKLVRWDSGGGEKKGSEKKRSKRASRRRPPQPNRPDLTLRCCAMSEGEEPGTRKAMEEGKAAASSSVTLTETASPIGED